MDRKIYLPIFLPDVEQAQDPELELLSEEIFLPEVAADPALRLALYELAWLNVSLMHGPMELAWFSEKSRYLVFLELSSDSSTRPAMLQDLGIEPMKNLPFARAGQRIVWASDNSDSIVPAFQAMASQIEAWEDARL